MSALSHFLETEGLSTTGISLVREHTEAMAPPRALWVPFPLGRPLGAAGDAAFQHRVIAAALALLDRPEGPVLEDFPDAAPEDGSGEPWSCPVRFARIDDAPVAAGPARAEDARKVAGAAGAEDAREITGQARAENAQDVSDAARVEDARELAGTARTELAGLAGWHELARRRRGRTAPATSGLAVERCLELVIDAWEAGGTDDVRRLKAAVEDLKTHYVEAATARPGAVPTGAVDTMLWNESALGRLLRGLAARGSDSGDAAMRFFANDSLVPRRFR